VVIGYVPGGLGGPWALAGGRSVTGDGEIVLDRTLAADHGIALGDRSSLLGSPLSVVGLSRETQSFMGVSYLFVSETTAARLFGMATTATFILFRPDTTAVEGVISDRTGLSAMGASVVAAADRAQYTRLMARPLQLMIDAEPFVKAGTCSRRLGVRDVPHPRAICIHYADFDDLAMAGCRMHARRHHRRDRGSQSKLRP
jgi:hypothetical protein